MAVTEAARTDVTDAGSSPRSDAVTLPAGRAARELELRRGEFELAVHLGLISTVTQAGGGRPRVRGEEIDRLRAQADFPESLREKVRTAGTAEGAALLGISPVRFTRLARVGCVSPVTFCLNRYRAVVWLYLTEELTGFAAREPGLLAGRTPVGMRTMLEAGTDWRARNWRSRRIDRLLSSTDDPWARAAVQACALDPVQLAEVVDDLYERAYLARVKPEPVFGRPGSVSGREAMGELMLADDPDEILWRRVNLALELDRAREARQAPRPGEDRDRRGVPELPGVRRGVPLLPPERGRAHASTPTPATAAAGRSTTAACASALGLLTRIGRRGRRHRGH